MSIKDHLNKDELHHAYIFYGNHKDIYPNLVEYIESELAISAIGNPDFQSVTEDVLSINTVRSLVDSSSRKSLTEKKIYIIKSRNITHESQNALLKILEEPNPGTHFFILMQNKGMILPTLQSRVIEIDAENTAAQEDVVDFINSNVTERLKLIEEMVKDKDRNRASQLINGMLEERGRVALNPATIKALAIGAQYIDLPSSSVKMILENIALKFKKK